MARQLSIRVRLRPLLPSDRARVRRWMADPELLRFTVQVPGPDYLPVRPYLPAEADRYLHEMTSAPDRRVFAIELDGQHVGNVGLKRIEPATRRAECFIEIGEAWARGQGVGRQAMELLVEHAFGALGLEVLWLGVFEFNLAAIRMYRSLGFAQGAAYGEHHVAGRVYQVLGMSLRSADWSLHRAAGRR